jgi:hypothetical protein
VSHGKNILSGVDIPVMVHPTLRANPLPYIQRQLINNLTAISTAFRTGEPTVYFYQVSTIPLGFIFQLSDHFAPASITYSTTIQKAGDAIYSVRLERFSDRNRFSDRSLS